MWEAFFAVHICIAFREFLWRHVAQRAMWTHPVVIDPPEFNRLSRIVQCQEPVLVQALLAEPAVETRCSRSHALSTAPSLGSAGRRFRVTHPFHPWLGREFELIVHRSTWGEDRVFYYDPGGKLKSLLANVTDIVPTDDFRRVSAGRSAFRMDDLLELRRLFDKHRYPSKEGQDV